ncbi:unnamed protein product [Caenorhabditis brenneri]
MVAIQRKHFSSIYCDSKKLMNFNCSQLSRNQNEKYAVRGESPTVRICLSSKNIADILFNQTTQSQLSQLDGTVSKITPDQNRPILDFGFCIIGFMRIKTSELRI